ncbi:MAG: serine/threonine protein kinase [Planctomycetes bacterium]|nr:serine/threonine protein kinase [Planctomycetota bacterium]
MTGSHRHTIGPLAPKKFRLSDLFRRSIGPGRVIRSAGAYRILRLLGKGGMGRVYLAEKLGTHEFTKLMAVKVLPKQGLVSAADRQMFVNEARVCAGLNHPNIVQVYQLGETRSEYFIVMEHVFGVTLLDYIERHLELQKPVPIGFSVYIMTRVLSGLHYAHNKHNRDGLHLGIVHRDICPNNVLISYRGIPKLSDFGVAKTKLTFVEDETKVVFGKYPYMAPEQIKRKGTEPRSDIYSLGLVMYELFTGRIAHEVNDTKMLLEDLEQREILPPHEANPLVPIDLSKIIMKAIALDRDDRFKSAKAMRLALETFLLKSFMFPEQDDFADYLCELFPQAAKHRWW